MESKCMQGITLVHVGKRIYRIPIPCRCSHRPCKCNTISLFRTDEAETKLKDKSNHSAAENITIELTFPQILHRFIIGKNGNHLKEIQRDSKAIVLLKRGDDNIIIKGTNKSVDMAKSRIQEVVKSRIAKLPPTHFLSLPLTDPHIQRKVATFQSEVISLSIPNVDSSLMIKPPSLHLTIGMLSLYRQEDISSAVCLLKSLGAEIFDLVDTRTVIVKLKGVAIMENNPEKANILYAKVEEPEGQDILLKIADFLKSKFTKAGYLNKDNRPMKYHATLINSKHREVPHSSLDESIYEKHVRIPFSAATILDKFTNIDFGTSRIESINISRIGVFEKNGRHQNEGILSLSKMQD